VVATVLPNGSYYLPGTDEIIPADMATPSPDDRFHRCTYYPISKVDRWGEPVWGKHKTRCFFAPMHSVVLAGIRSLSLNVRYRGQPGQHVLVLSITGFDPKATFETKPCKTTWSGVVPCRGGPQLRLDYRDQPLGESLIIAMEPVSFPGR
jgi:hypothetical protein